MNSSANTLTCLHSLTPRYCVSDSGNRSFLAPRLYLEPMWWRCWTRPMRMLRIEPPASCLSCRLLVCDFFHRPYATPLCIVQIVPNKNSLGQDRALVFTGLYSRGRTAGNAIMDRAAHSFLENQKATWGKSLMSSPFSSVAVGSSIKNLTCSRSMVDLVISS